MTRVATDGTRDDPGARGRAEATGPRWRKLWIAAALGLVAGATLFATQAQGRDAERQSARDRRRSSGL